MWGTIWLAAAERFPGEGGSGFSKSNTSCFRDVMDFGPVSRVLLQRGTALRVGGLDEGRETEGERNGQAEKTIAEG